jgi:VWFA-related protein
MRSIPAIGLILLLGFPVLAQEQYEVTVVDIEVPVRVLDNGRFVEDLNPQDFEIYENGVLQDVKSMYLIRNTDLARQEGADWSTPNTARRFFMLFQFLDYNPQLADAIDFFFQSIMQPDDTLTIMTPLKRYDLSREALQTQTPEKLSRDLQTVVRKDTKLGAADYNSLLSDLRKIARSISSATGATSAMSGMEGTDTGSDFGLEFQLPRYKETLERLDELRMVNEKRFFSFAGQLKRMEGRKVVFFFYQREYRPEIEPRYLNLLISQYQDQPNILSAVQDLFTMYSRSDKMNDELLGQAFSDASTMFNFIFMDKEPEDVRGIVMREQSEDVFNAFARVTEATGGVMDTSQNPSDGFENAARACSEYYLLVYSPKNFQQDGSYKSIEVTVKGRDFNVQHRSGYFAR